MDADPSPWSPPPPTHSIIALESRGAYYEGLVEATFAAPEALGTATRVLKARQRNKKDESSLACPSGSPFFPNPNQVVDRRGLHMTVLASFSVHAPASGGLHACALRLVPLPAQMPPQPPPPPQHTQQQPQPPPQQPLQQQASGGPPGAAALSSTLAGQYGGGAL